jgi:hypothetical protein
MVVGFPEIYTRSENDKFKNLLGVPMIMLYRSRVVYGLFEVYLKI